MMPSQGFGLFPGSPPFCDPSLVFGFFASGGFFFYTRGFRAVKNGPHPGLIIIDFSGERGSKAAKVRETAKIVSITPYFRPKQIIYYQNKGERALRRWVLGAWGLGNRVYKRYNI